MINRTMANIDVKLGIKHILERVEQAYLKRGPVSDDQSLSLFQLNQLFIVSLFASYFRTFEQQSQHWWPSVKPNPLKWSLMHIRRDNGILVKIMWKNCGRKVQMSSLTNNVQTFVGISLAICNPAKLVRYDWSNHPKYDMALHDLASWKYWIELFISAHESPTPWNGWNPR